MNNLMVKIEGTKAAYCPISFWEKKDGTLNIKLETEFSDCHLIVSPKMDKKELEEFVSKFEKAGYGCELNYIPFRRAICGTCVTIIKLKGSEIDES